MSNDHDTTQNTDINKQAIAAGTTPEKLKKQLAQSSQSTDQQASANSEQTSTDHLQDGYRLNEGSDYSAQPTHDEQQQEGYDPTHSGVRHAQNKPGMHTNGPGREGQTGWSEQLQMGKTADTPERKNPAD